jgi:hypothetical protein
MPIEKTNQPAYTLRFPRNARPRALWARRTAVAAAAAFVVSSAFPLVAGFVKDTEAWPRWWGRLDVALAFVLAVLAIAVIGLAQGKLNRPAEDASYRAYRVLSHGILGMLVVFFLLGDRIIWAQCLTGFAWRTWLLLYTMPAWFTLFSASEGSREASSLHP